MQNVRKVRILRAVNITRLMSVKLQSCNKLNGTNRKEGWRQQEKKSFLDRKTCEAIVCKEIICHSGVIREILPRLNRIVLLSCLGKN